MVSNVYNPGRLKTYNAVPLVVYDELGTGAFTVTGVFGDICVLVKKSKVNDEGI